MKEELDEIMKGAAVSSYSNFANIGLSSALASFIIMLIGASAYGVVSAIQQGSGIIHTLIGNIKTGLNRTIPRLADNEKRTVVISCILLTLLELGVLLSLIYIFRELLFQYTLISKSQSQVLIAGLVFIFCYNVFTIIAEILRAYKKIPETNLIEKWIYPILQFGLLFISSLITSVSVTTVLYTIALSAVLSTLIGIYLIKRQTTLFSIDISKNTKPVIKFITYTVFVGISGLFSMFQFTAPNILVFSLLSIQAGAFGIAMLFGSLSRIPLTSINTIFPQVATELYDNNEIQKINSLFKSTSKIALFFTLPMAMFFTIFHSEVIGIFSEEYVQYSEIIPLVISGHVIAVMAGTVGLLILMTDNERQNIIVQFIGSVLSLAILIPLTLKYNVFGLAAGYAITLIINNSIELIYLYYKENIVSITIEHIKMLLLGIIFAIIGYIIKLHSPVYISLSIVCLLISTVMYINYTAFFNKTERKALITYKTKSIKYIKQKIL